MGDGAGDFGAPAVPGPGGGWRDRPRRKPRGPGLWVRRSRMARALGRRAHRGGHRGRQGLRGRVRGAAGVAARPLAARGHGLDAAPDQPLSGRLLAAINPGGGFQAHAVVGTDGATCTSASVSTKRVQNGILPGTPWVAWTETDGVAPRRSGSHAGTEPPGGVIHRGNRLIHAAPRERGPEHGRDGGWRRRRGLRGRWIGRRHGDRGAAARERRVDRSGCDSGRGSRFHTGRARHRDGRMGERDWITSVLASHTPTPAPGAFPSTRRPVVPRQGVEPRPRRGERRPRRPRHRTHCRHPGGDGRRVGRERKGPRPGVRSDVRAIPTSRPSAS